MNIDAHLITAFITERPGSRRSPEMLTSLQDLLAFLFNLALVRTGRFSRGLKQITRSPRPILFPLCSGSSAFSLSLIHPILVYTSDSRPMAPKGRRDSWFFPLGLPPGAWPKRRPRPVFEEQYRGTPPVRFPYPVTEGLTMNTPEPRARPPPPMTCPWCGRFPAEVVFVRTASIFAANVCSRKQSLARACRRFARNS